MHTHAYPILHSSRVFLGGQQIPGWAWTNDCVSWSISQVCIMQITPTARMKMRMARVFWRCSCIWTHRLEVAKPPSSRISWCPLNREQERPLCLITSCTIVEAWSRLEWSTRLRLDVSYSKATLAASGAVEARKSRWARKWDGGWWEHQLSCGVV